MMRRFAENNSYSLVSAGHDELELTDTAAVTGFFEGEKPDYVILAAGRVGGIAENTSFPADFITENLAIQLNVLQAARRANVKKLLLFASSCMYPRQCSQPMNETQLFSGHPEPTSMPYAVSKMAGMQMCHAFNKQMGEQRFIPLIPNSAYGPNDNFDPDKGHVLSALIRRFHLAKSSGSSSVELWGSGAPRREFVHADDVAGACEFLLQRDLSETELPLNIGTGSDISIAELASIISQIVGYGGSIEWNTGKPDGAPRKLLDSRRLHTLGWRANTTLRDGLEQTYAWYVDNIADMEPKS